MTESALKMFLIWLMGKNVPLKDQVAKRIERIFVTYDRH